MMGPVRGSGVPVRRGFRTFSAGLVQCPGQFPVSRPRGIEFLGPLIELAPHVGQVLFEQRDAALKLVDACGCAKAGFLPGGFTEALG